MKIENLVVYRQTSEQCSSGAQDSCFDLIGSHQLRIPCSTRNGTDELNLMMRKGHQTHFNSACGAENKAAIHNTTKIRKLMRKSCSQPLVATVKHNKREKTSPYMVTTKLNI